jgi:8-oxo-dGTP diphosphatase
MKFEFSAGGIVVKKVHSTDSGLQNLILVCQHSQHHGWVFPKGLIGDHVKGEQKEDTALREVEEETGVKGEIIRSLTSVEYWYIFEGKKIKKTVYYFLMEYVAGNITNHDQEMENVEWLPEDEVAKLLTYPSDKKVWQEAQKLI